jgi:HEAT repeat protein
VPDYLAGRIAPEVLRRFEAHLAVCESCQHELRQFEATWTALGGLPDEEPSPALRSRFYTMLEDEKRTLARAARPAWPQRFAAWAVACWPRRPAAGLAVSLGLMAVCFVAGWGARPREGGSDAVAELRAEVQQMNQLVSLTLLSQESPSQRLRGVNWSTRVRRPSPDLLTSLTATLTSDSNENVRLAAVDALGAFRDEPGVFDALAHSLSQETSPLVQIALIDLLVALREAKALDALNRFLAERDAAAPVKQHAAEILGASL